MQYLSWNTLKYYIFIQFEGKQCFSCYIGFWRLSFIHSYPSISYMCVSYWIIEVVISMAYSLTLTMQVTLWLSKWCYCATRHLSVLVINHCREIYHFFWKYWTLCNYTKGLKLTVVFPDNVKFSVFIYSMLKKLAVKIGE